MPPGSGLDTDFNYVRNSVKATVDAYDGTVHFYVVDPTDPIIQTYRKAFPDLFDDVEGHAGGLREHWRYPEDIFDTQTEQYTQYHMTDPEQFFQKGDAVGHRAESRRRRYAATAATVRRAERQQRRPQHDAAAVGEPDRSAVPDDAAARRSKRPGVRAPAIVRAAAKANQLSSFMFARQRRRELREARRSTRCPTTRPRRRRRGRRSLIEADPIISSQFSLLDQRGSQVDPGRRAARSRSATRSSTCGRSTSKGDRATQPFPRWNYVAVTYGENAVLGQTSVADAVKHLLDRHDPDVERTNSTGDGSRRPPTTTPTTTPDDHAEHDADRRPTRPSRSCSRRAASSDDANAALADQDLAAYGRGRRAAADSSTRPNACWSRLVEHDHADAELHDHDRPRPRPTTTTAARA